MARDPDHDRIQRKAHELWEAAGKPHGSDQKHWDEAREIIAIEDSQSATLKPRRSGAKPPVEEASVALGNEGEFPNLTDQGENLLTSTDREPDLLATPSAKKGRMPKAEVPTSDQPGIAPKGRKSAAKPAADKDPAPKAAAKTAKTIDEAQPKASGAPKAKNAAKASSEPKAARSKKPA